MLRTLRAVLLALVLLPATGCVSPSAQDELRADHEAHEVEFDRLQGELQKWTQDLHQWEASTYVALCDALAKNPAAYAEETALYCPADDADEETVHGGPPAPPAFR